MILENREVMAVTGMQSLDYETPKMSLLLLFLFQKNIAYIYILLLIPIDAISCMMICFQMHKLLHPWFKQFHKMSI